MSRFGTSQVQSGFRPPPISKLQSRAYVAALDQPLILVLIWKEATVLMLDLWHYEFKPVLRNVLMLSFFPECFSISVLLTAGCFLSK